MRHREGAPYRPMLPWAISCRAKVCRHRALRATVALGAQKREPDHMDWRDDKSKTRTEDVLCWRSQVRLSVAVGRCRNRRNYCPPSCSHAVVGSRTEDRVILWPWASCAEVFSR